MWQLCNKNCLKILSSNFNKATFVVLRWPTRKKWINGSWPWRREFRMASLADDFFIPTVVIVFLRKRLILWIWAKRSNAAMLALAGAYFIHFGDPVVARFRHRMIMNDHEWSSRSVQVKQNSLLPPALQHPRILAEGYFTNYFSVGLDAKTATCFDVKLR